MDLSITRDERRTLAEAAQAVAEQPLLLGIIEADGVVRLVRSDPVVYPHHAEWLQRCPTLRPKRGFSIGFFRGDVHVFPQSGLNDPAWAYLLEEGVAPELVKVLRLDEYGRIVLYRE